jgi:hypothetical protein
MGDLAARRPVNKIAIRTMNQPGTMEVGGFGCKSIFIHKGEEIALQ